MRELQKKAGEPGPPTHVSPQQLNHKQSSGMQMSALISKEEEERRWACLTERSEKDQNCKLQFPQPDYEPRHSPNFRTVFGIMIGPFSFCEIGKTWGTNKQVNKQTNKNWNFQFPQPDYWPRHSPDFRTVFGIINGPFSFCKIGKTWGT